MARRFWCALALVVLLGALLWPVRARAQDDESNITLCKRILSRMLCKPYNEFSYAGAPEPGVYLIGVFYGSRNSEYFCAVDGGRAIVQDRTWHPIRRVFLLQRRGRCVTTRVHSVDCPSRAVVRACRSRSREDVREQKMETFWSRPVPKILEDEYKAMTSAGQQNSTAGTPAAAPAK